MRSPQLRDRLYPLYLEADFCSISPQSAPATANMSSPTIREADVGSVHDSAFAVPPGQYCFEGLVANTKLPARGNAITGGPFTTITPPSSATTIGLPTKVFVDSEAHAAAVVPGSTAAAAPKQGAWAVAAAKPSSSVASAISIGAASSLLSLSPGSSSIGGGPSSAMSPSSCWGQSQSHGSHGAGASFAERLKAAQGAAGGGGAKVTSSAAIVGSGGGPRVVQQGFHPPQQLHPAQQHQASRLKSPALSATTAPLPPVSSTPPPIRPQQLTSLVLNLSEGGSLSG